MGPAFVPQGRARVSPGSLRDMSAPMRAAPPAGAPAPEGFLVPVSAPAGAGSTGFVAATTSSAPTISPASTERAMGRLRVVRYARAAGSNQEKAMGGISRAAAFVTRTVTAKILVFVSASSRPVTLPSGTLKCSGGSPPAPSRGGRLSPASGASPRTRRVSSMGSPSATTVRLARTVEREAAADGVDEARGPARDGKRPDRERPGPVFGTVHPVSRAAQPEAVAGLAGLEPREDPRRGELERSGVGEGHPGGKAKAREPPSVHLLVATLHR